MSPHRETSFILGTAVIVSIIAFLIAEFFGRRKHIGRWWSFALLLNGFIFGIIAIIVSPSAKKQPTKGTSAHKVWGIILMILGALNLSISLTIAVKKDIFDAKSLVGIYLIILGYYLKKIYHGKIINKNPKYYFDDIFDKVSSKTESFQGFSTSSSTNKTNYLYYIIENNQQSQSLTFDQLKAKRITEDTLVWRNGLEDWVKAKNLREIASVIYRKPPPLPKNTPPPLRNRATPQTSNYGKNNTSHNTTIIKDKYLIGGVRYTLYELEDKFRKGEYPFYRDDTIMLIKNNNLDSATVVTIYNHSPLQQFQKYFQSKN